MTTKSHLFADILKTPGYLAQFEVLRIRNAAKGNTDEDFKEFFSCDKASALRILGFWEVAQVELWDAEILKRFFHVWIYEDRDMVAARIQAAQKAGRLPQQFTPELGLQWLEYENVAMGRIPEWVRANARRRTPQAPAIVEAVPRGEAQDAAILDALKEGGFDPLKLPKNKPGKPGAKATVRTALVGVNRSFPKEGTQFDHAWERLRQRGDIADES